MKKKFFIVFTIFNFFLFVSKLLTAAPLCSIPEEIKLTNETPEQTDTNNANKNNENEENKSEEEIEDEKEIEISADKKIEVDKENGVMIATGNAFVKDGVTSLSADILTAFSCETNDGDTKILQINADDNVVIKSDQGNAYANRAIYFVEKKIIELYENVKLEKDGKGLNLTEEVREGMLHHSKPKGDFMSSTLVEGIGLEAQVIRISDAIAYLNHDLGDAFRAGVLTEADLPYETKEFLGRRHSERVDRMVMDIICTSSGLLENTSLTSPPTISMSRSMRDATNTLRNFMFERVYMPVDSGPEGKTARLIINVLYEALDSNHDLIPNEFLEIGETIDHAIVDYISGMTDGFAIRTAESLSPGAGQVFAS